MTDYVEQLANKVRKDPLGPVTLNQAQANIEAVNGKMLHEHFSDGQHNALEVPWILGHVDVGTTGYLFDSAFGGSSIARPSTGRATINAVSGVVGDVDTPTTSAAPAASVIANVSDGGIVNFPYVVEVEMVSATSIAVRTRAMTSTLGSPGNSWSDADAAFEIAVHAQKQPVDLSALGSHLLKQRRDFLTEEATDWNALVANQGTVRKALSLEHVPDENLTTFPGDHLVDRIAKASGLFVPVAGPSYSAIVSRGTGGLSRISTGVVEVTLSEYDLASTDLAACFCQAQPTSENELIIVNGRCHAAGAGSTTFRFYVYAYSVAENKWSREDRAFFAIMFGRPA